MAFYVQHSGRWKLSKYKYICDLRNNVFLYYNWQNDLTGEHSCIMLKELNAEDSVDSGQWLSAFWKGEF